MKGRRISAGLEGRAVSEARLRVCVCVSLLKVSEPVAGYLFPERWWIFGFH